MRTLISPEVMLACERAHFARTGEASIDFMERAARAITDTALARFPAAKTVCVACGPGGNGGDGYACARMLHEAGLNVALFPAAEARSPDARINAERARALGLTFAEAAKAAPAPDIWIDALYGTGLSRAPEGIARALIERMNADHERGAHILAADIPSGLSGASGRAFSPTVRADVTVALQCEKAGYYLEDGFDHCGEIVRADIGFPESAFPDNLPRLLEPGDLRALFTPRPRNLHKGRCGRLLIIAGSLGMAGAAALCARAALRSGVGLASVACPESIVPILQALAPCATCVPLPETNGAIAPEAANIVREALRGKSAAVIGCGLSRRADPSTLRSVLESDVPAVIDADGLNLLAAHPELKALLKARHILTPHPGEAARLLGRPCESALADAKALARTGATVVLKGTGRVICGEETLLSASGGCAMARGGSGDVLSGILGALLAEDSSRGFAQTAAAACEIHGLCGEKMQRRYGPRAANAADLIEFLPEVFKEYVD